MSPKFDLPYYTVDAFTDTPFRGNPAAVCLIEPSISEATMQRIASEMNLSETAFVLPPDSNGVRSLRWFTPSMEVSLCGHATLATAHALLVEENAEPPLRFSTASGTLPVHREPDGALSMNFPADPPRSQAPPPGLLSALGCPEGVPALRSERLWIVSLPTRAEVVELTPDFKELAAVEVGGGALGVSVTAPGEGDVEFVSRFFGPWVGVDEDPVTGAAHTALAPYWAEKLGRTALRARQLSRRGGAMDVRVDGGRVHLVGRAVTVARGRIRSDEPAG